MRSEAAVSDHSGTGTPVDGVSLDGVSVHREGRTILRDVTLDLSARRTAVIGANGSGKSTFARLLNGLVTPTSGKVVVRGRDVQRDLRAVRREVGFVFTDPQAQILMPTPAEDLSLSLRDLPRPEARDRIAAILDEHGLAGHADASVSTLSGGQRQLLALASVLATTPSVVVADEPTTLLDLRNARRIGDLLLAQDAQVIIVTHDLDLAARCDHAVLFDDGSVAASGEPDAVIDEYRRSCV